MAPAFGPATSFTAAWSAHALGQDGRDEGEGQVRLEWERRWKATHGGRVDMAELCRMFGITPPTGYLWIARYRAAGPDLCALQERSRRPHGNPRAVAPSVEEFIVDARKERSRWGARKLRAWLADRHPGRVWPSASCIADILSVS